MGGWAWLALLAAVAASLALAACEEGGGPTMTPTATSSPTATATASPTPAGETGGMEGFRAFAAQIQAAIAAADGTLFADRAFITEIECTGADELGPCAGRPAGTTVSGVFSGIWRTDAVDLVSPDTIAEGFAGFINGADVGQADEFGIGLAVLYALARSQVQDQEAFLAIVAAILRDENDQPIRRVQVYQFLFRDGRWQLFGQIAAGGLYGEWLSGDCADCYTGWERWEGGPALGY